MLCYSNGTDNKKVKGLTKRNMSYFSDFKQCTKFDQNMFITFWCFP